MMAGIRGGLSGLEYFKRMIAGEELFRKQVDELTVRLSP